GLRKGVPFLIRAMKTVREQVPDSMLVCVGGVPSWLPKGDYWSYLRGLVAKNDLEKQVLLLDRVPNERLPNYYSMADVFVLPSYYEAFPKVLIEAMACEKPAISSRMGGTQDSIEDGVNGYLVNYADPEALAAAIVPLLQDGSLARKMGAIGRQRVLREFTWDAVASRFDAIYGEVLK
ncbi:MAG: glycosyltransferase family 4 protein, partial [Nitrososphaerales archaeon]